MRENAPSATAKIVAKNLAVVRRIRKTSHLVSPAAAILNKEFIEDFSSAGSASFPKWCEYLWFQTLFRFYEKITIPGLALHHALRKLYIENIVRQSIASAAAAGGFTQVVILGGGFDTLAVRLGAEFPSIGFFELDHPATQGVKRKAIEKRFPRAGNIKLLPVDLTEPFFLESLLSSPAYHPERDTVFICEGVTMYLEADAVENIFKCLKRAGPGRKRFIFTFMEIDRKGDKNFRNSTILVNLWLRLKKEPFKWGLRESELKDFLCARAFDLEQSAGAETLRKLYLAPAGLAHLPLATGENICVCNCAG